jgi:hypothetical protein
MIKQPSKIKACSSQSLLVIILGAVGISLSCDHFANRPTRQLRDRPQERPVPFIPTTENEGKRCEAKVYFGRRFDGSDEGYTDFCYELQLRLTTAAREGNLAEIRETLTFGANVNLSVDDSYPPLQVAALRGHADAVRLLLDNGAEVNDVSGPGNTALNAAASYGHLEVVQVLMERGADVCYGFIAGERAGDMAQSNGHKEVAELLKNAEAAKKRR